MKSKKDNCRAVSKQLMAIVGLLLLASLLVACGGAEDRKAKYFAKGQTLFEEGNYVKAELEFKNVLQIDPKDTEALFMLGKVAEKSQEWRRAFAAYSTVLELDPKHVPALVKRGHLYLLGGTPEKALQDAESAMETSPENVDALVLRGAAQNKLGMTEAAMTDAGAALELEPGNASAVSLLGGLYSKQGKTDEAIDLTVQAIEKDPDNVGLRLVLASFYDKAGDQRKAIDQLEKIIALQPDNLKSRLRLSNYHTNMGNRDDAEKVLRDTVQTSPDNVDAKLLLAEFLAKQKGAEQAEKQLLDFIEQYPESHKLRFGLAKLYRAMGEKDKAKSVYETIIDRQGLAPDGLNARDKLARLLFTEGKVDAAEKLVGEVLKEDPKDDDALMIRAGVALVHKDSDQAITDVRSILGRAPDNVKATRLLARAHLQKNDVDLARETLQKAADTHPQDVDTSLELARLLAGTGDPEDAIRVLQKLLKVVPGNYEALKLLGTVQFRQKRWSVLKQTAGELKTLYPDKLLGYYLMGMVHKGQKAYAESVDEFIQAMKLDPEATDPLMELSKSYLAMGQTDQALERVQAVLEVNPDSIVALDLLGEIYLVQNRFTEAETTFRKIIGMNPKWAPPYGNLANLYMYRQDTKQAIETLQQGTEATGGSSGLRLRLASLYEKLGEDDNAKIVYEAILRQTPDSMVAANNLAMLLLKGKPDLVALDKALRLAKPFDNSNNAILLDTLGWVYYKRGAYDQAQSALERATLYGEEFPVLNYHLGMAYFKKGKVSEARTHLQKALDSGEKFFGIEEARKTLMLEN